jgi:SAM-dependent methyltransferase
MDNEKYVHDPIIHRSDDAQCIVPVIMELFHPRSVLDVGCGLGNFLQEFQNAGVQDVTGIEGSWLDKSKLVISEQYVQIHDLETEVSLGRKFDVALCLEVAEHLKPEAAEHLVKTLTTHSDVVVFSAAIPYQGGQNHINEQWLGYWQTLFANYEFDMYDVIRHRIWNDNRIYWWYRQNIVVCCSANAQQKFEPTTINNYVHPELYMAKVNQVYEYSALLENIYNGDIAIEVIEEILTRAKSKRDT